MYLWRALMHMHFFAGVLVPFFTDWGGLSLNQMFLLQAWFFLWIFLLEVPTGALADKYGRRAYDSLKAAGDERFFGGTRRYLLWSAALPGLAFLALPFATNPWAACALFVTIPAFGLSRSVLIANYLNKHVDSPRRATVLSPVSMGSQLIGVIVLPTVGLLTKLSLGWTFAALGAAILACAWASSVEEEHLTV